MFASPASAKRARLFVVPEPGDPVLSQKIRWETIELDTHHTDKQKIVIYILIKANIMLLHTFFFYNALLIACIRICLELERRLSS